MEVREEQLKVSHGLADCLYWNLFFVVPIVTACLGILRHSVGWTIIYLLLTVLTFAVAVYRFFCTHCPHYIKGEGKVNCLFLRRVPKFFKERPGPYGFLEKLVVMISVLIWVVFPLYWLYKSVGLLVIYGVSLAVLAATIRRYECGRCIHFDCPVNSVEEDVRTSYLRKA
ncbi:MAG: hypothetical protein PVH35_07415 [Syntrophobacterales bacterium]